LATHKSAEKRARQNKKRQLRNVSIKSNVKSRLKAVLGAVEDKKKDDSRKALAEAIVVIDNTACGAGIGGVRMAPDVSVEECFRLARAMTWKNAAAGLPHGGEWGPD